MSSVHVKSTHICQLFIQKPFNPYYKHSGLIYTAAPSFQYPPLGRKFSSISTRNSAHWKPVKCHLSNTEYEKHSDWRCNNIKRKNLAVFVSGQGSNLRALNKACEEEIVNADITVLVTDKPDCGGAQYARAKGIPVILFPKSTSVSHGLSPSDLGVALRRYEIDFILLAGFLKFVPTEIIQAYPRAVVNLHPSLLPAFGGKGFYGLNVHKAVISSGARYSGPTVHFVDEHYDTGPIIAQRVVDVLTNDTAESLAARVLEEEHRLYVDVAAALCDERVIWREDGVPLIQSRDMPDEYR